MRKFRPLVDKLFWIIFIPTMLLLIAATVIAAFAPTALFIALPIDVIVIYLLIAPLFGYVELREKSVYIKYGLILKKEIPYSKIRGVAKERKAYSDSMVSLKNALEHVNIKYNTFDVASVSVKESETFITELEGRISTQ